PESKLPEHPGIAPCSIEFLIDFVGVNTLNSNMPMCELQHKIASFGRYRPPYGQEDTAVCRRFDWCNAQDAGRQLDVPVDAGACTLHSGTGRIADLAGKWPICCFKGNVRTFGCRYTNAAGTKKRDCVTMLAVEKFRP